GQGSPRAVEVYVPPQRASEASEHGRGAQSPIDRRSHDEDPHRGSPHAVEVYVPQRASEASDGNRRRPRGAKTSPAGGHHMRSKSTCPKERAKRASATEDGRGGLKRPPPGVTTCGRSLRAPERAKRAARPSTAAGG